MNTWARLQLVKKYLQSLQNIPDMAIYAETWKLLGIEFLIIGASANAAYCQARAVYYRQMVPGEYIRLIDQPVAELIHVPEVPNVRTL
jgi:hypothetical protein